MKHRLHMRMHGTPDRLPVGLRCFRAAASAFGAECPAALQTLPSGAGIAEVVAEIMRATQSVTPDSYALQAGFSVTIRPGCVTVGFGSGRSGVEFWVGQDEWTLTCGVWDADTSSDSDAWGSAEERWQAAQSVYWE